MSEAGIVENSSWQREHALLCDAVREAGELALAMFNKGVDTWDKQDGTPVSEADLAVDKLLNARLRGALDGAGWLSEETTRDSTCEHQRLVWVVDPIDGTSSFISGGEHWCVGACLLSDGRPVASAAFAPVQGRLYEALAGGGARLNDAAITVSSRTALDGCSAVAHKSALQSSRWQGNPPAVRCAMTTSLILRQCLVATGEHDIAIAFGQKSDWDLAPGELIVSEAGGQARDLAGHGFKYNQRSTRQNGLVAGPGVLLDAVGERLHSKA